MKRLQVAAIAGGLALAALLGCRDEPSVASKSAAAFREAQKRGETFGGDGHAHGHGAVTPGGAQTAPDAPAAAPHAGHGEEPPAGHARHDHGAAEAPVAGGGHGRHGAEDTGRPGGDHAAMGHGPRDKPGAAPHAGHGARSPQAPASGAQPPHSGHAGHGAMAPQAPTSSTQPPSAGHAGHAPSRGAAPAVPSAPAPVAVPSEQPARTLSPDPLDAPAATSVQDAQRSAEMSQEMSGGGHGGDGGHGGHGGTYRHVDAGRGPESGHSHEPPGGGAGAGLYVCPMHPEVTSETPGTCPQCGMTLVERRKE